MSMQNEASNLIMLLNPFLVTHKDILIPKNKSVKVQSVLLISRFGFGW